MHEWDLNQGENPVQKFDYNVKFFPVGESIYEEILSTVTVHL